MRSYTMSNKIYYPKEYSKLSALGSEISKTTLCLISGNMGIGKSYLIQQFLNGYSGKKIYLKESPNNVDVYYSIKRAVDDNNTDSIRDLTQDILYTASITKDFVALCQANPKCALWIDDISTFNSKALKQIHEILKILLLLNSELKILILIECSKDRLSEENSAVFYDIRSLIEQVNIIELQRPDMEVFTHYFKTLFKQPIAISHPMIQHICKSAFFNFLYIKRYVEYLKDNQIIYQENNFWYCSDIDHSISCPLLEQTIRERYNKLDNRQQDVIQKASITGMEINIELLKRPLSILNPRRKLDVIERISNLVESQRGIYSFETDDVYFHVKNTIDEATWRELHKLIAEYLQSDISREFSQEAIYDIRRKSYEISLHYEFSGKYEEAFHFLLICISYSKELKDFDAVIKCCQKAFLLLEVCKVNQYYRLFLYWNQAVAFENLSKFELAVNDYEISIKLNKKLQMYDYIALEYHYGYCQRRAGHTDKAYQQLDKLRKKLLDSDDEKNQQLLVKTLVVLIGILDQIGNTELKERYFNQSLTLSQHFVDKDIYYELLTKSSLYYSSEIANPFMLEAFNYFDENNKRFDTAKAAYNLGMNEIYNYKLDNASQHITYAYEIFSFYGGNNICYPTCAMGILAAIDKNYCLAIQHFTNVVQFATNNFAKITANINLCHCYRKLQNYNMANAKLKIAGTLLKEDATDKMVLTRNYLFAKAMMLYEVPAPDLVASYLLIKEAFQTETDLGYSTYNIYLAKWIMKLSKCIGEKNISPQIITLSKKKLTTYKQFCYDDKVMWGNFMFW